MKTTKLIFPLVLALAATLATTGCKHKPVGVTKLPGQKPMSAKPTIRPNFADLERQSIRKPSRGATPLANPDVFDNMLADRAALAAYTIHFAYDSSAIRSSEKANLASVAQQLSGDASTKLLIEGNCDERGTEEYNRSLGERRALAAREALAKLGVDPMRVETRSFGKDKPVDPGHDESGWAKNRRDDFVLLHPKPGS